jgi:hypothetical protein
MIASQPSARRWKLIARASRGMVNALQSIIEKFESCEGV